MSWWEASPFTLMATQVFASIPIEEPTEGRDGLPNADQNRAEQSWCMIIDCQMKQQFLFVVGTFDNIDKVITIDVRWMWNWSLWPISLHICCRQILVGKHLFSFSRETSCIKGFTYRREGIVSSWLSLLDFLSTIGSSWLHCGLLSLRKHSSRGLSRPTPKAKATSWKPSGLDSEYYVFTSWEGLDGAWSWLVCRG